MRPTRLHIDTNALLHNLNAIQKQAKNSKVIAMVKANAYGCGVDVVTNTLTKKVDAFGVACVDEAIQIRKLGIKDPCIIFEGPHEQSELALAVEYGFELVIHHRKQIEWLTSFMTPKSIKVWIKINTGMNRLGFKDYELDQVVQELRTCASVDVPIGLMTHFACADEPEHPLHGSQKLKWKRLIKNWQGPISACNSAALWSSQDCIGSYIRPGLALYGISPFAHLIYKDLDLKPVMRFESRVAVIHELTENEYIGYGATFQTHRPTKLAIIPVGYGDGYPRHIQAGTYVSIGNFKVPIVGRVSMDKITVDITDYPGVQIGDLVELWGEYVPIEYVAKQSGTIPYELMCHVGPRERLLNLYLK